MGLSPPPSSRAGRLVRYLGIIATMTSDETAKTEKATDKIVCTVGNQIA
jgi:hypothetical protein